ncbi:ParA family protein [Sphingomonas morindae]|uniref:ParA family protein n=1 Tax=Sphingomonas morindae TaxID=1541170 RepID=A0ABY4X8F3_9SPHN|nr:ParA family protein [Sphingomonas morindae]USI73207.1 ParA family protein [Sphingomonas morindae]
MAIIAIYSAKGGVGKTTLAVNLAWCAAMRARRRTLVWDLDGQAAASAILARAEPRVPAREVIARDEPPEAAIVPTGVTGLDLLPADGSLRSLDALFAGLDKRKRLAKLSQALDRSYDRVLLDCPPGLGDTAEQVIRAADLIVLPLVPNSLSRRAFDEVRRHLGSGGKAPPVQPVFTLVDRRRAGHRAALAAEPDWPVVPAAAVVEQMADRGAAVGDYAPRTPAAAAFDALWVRIERLLCAPS